MLNHAESCASVVHRVLAQVLLQLPMHTQAWLVRALACIGMGAPLLAEAHVMTALHVFRKQINPDSLRPPAFADSDYTDLPTDHPIVLRLIKALGEVQHGPDAATGDESTLRVLNVPHVLKGVLASSRRADAWAPDLSIIHAPDTTKPELLSGSRRTKRVRNALVIFDVKETLASVLQLLHYTAQLSQQDQTLQLAINRLGPQLTVEAATDERQSSWMAAAHELKAEGNLLYRERFVRSACCKYAAAAVVAQLASDTAADGQSTPATQQEALTGLLTACHSNMAAAFLQRKASDEDFRAVVWHSTQCLRLAGDNTKAIYRYVNALKAA